MSKLNDEAALEAELIARGLVATRLMPQDIDAKIVGETYTVMGDGRVMICELTLKNGFTVRGESSVISKSNFRKDIGMRVSRENARDKIWELEAYLLTEKLYQEKIQKRSQSDS